MWHPWFHPLKFTIDTLKLRNMDGRTPKFHTTWLMVQVVPSEPIPLSAIHLWYVSSTLVTLDSTAPVEAVGVPLVSPLVCRAHPLNYPCGGCGG